MSLIERLRGAVRAFRGEPTLAARRSTAGAVPVQIVKVGGMPVRVVDTLSMGEPAGIPIRVVHQRDANQPAGIPVRIIKNRSSTDPRGVPVRIVK